LPINEGTDSGDTDGYGTSGQQVDEELEQDMGYCFLKLNVIII
jgi:hypothetical protein